VLLGLGILALVSLVFGMIVSVASDLPKLENKAEYRAEKNSVLYADAKRPTEIARLTGNKNRILVSSSEISPYIKKAVIAVEDRRFYRHKGVDYEGVARALIQDLLRKRAAQGGSTITQQFVKNALSAQGNRSIFQKLREAALAYHLERRWSKQKILTQYLNTVYFGNGAYGVESAVRTYFGQQLAGPGGLAGKAARNVTPAQAALLAGLIASPTSFDPVQNHREATKRRDLVLGLMLDRHFIGHGGYERAIREPVPGKDQINPPRVDSTQPYFSTWLTQQLVDRYGAGLVFGGGLKIRTTLDPELQQAAEHAIYGRLAGIGPDAAIVAIDNKSGAVKAMVGGGDYLRKPFNLATNGHRQPGSAFKPFTLVAALEDGVSPEATFTSQRKVFPVPGSRKEKFVVRNYDDQYAGVASLRHATATSDNSVFAELGLRVGTPKIAALAQRMGIETRVSTNPAMTLGGLKRGLTPLELAYAYSTIANKGVRVSGTLAPRQTGPVGIARVHGAGIDRQNQKRSQRVFPQAVGETAQELLTGVIQGGTGKEAQIGEWAAGKTGTTEDYGDAWFVGFNKDLTVAVWVGYADRLTPMRTEFRGEPVAGGTYPAEIWHDFMTSWISIRDGREAAASKNDHPALPGPQPSAPATPLPQQGAPAQAGPQNAAPKSREPKPPAQRKLGKEPAPKPAPAPQPSPQPSPTGGGQGGGAGAPPG
jgi:penicillin-binding protein 1A